MKVQRLIFKLSLSHGLVAADGVELAEALRFHSGKNDCRTRDSAGLRNAGGATVVEERRFPVFAGCARRTHERHYD